MCWCLLLPRGGVVAGILEEAEEGVERVRCVLLLLRWKRRQKEHREAMSTPQELEAKRKAEDDAKKVATETSGDGSLVTKNELRNEMRCMIQELMELGLIGTKTSAGSSKLKLELVPNDVKLEGSKNYLSWSRRVRVLLSGKDVEHYLEESCVEPLDKLSTEWKVWHTTNSTIVAWLLASMSPTVYKMVEAMDSAAQI